MRLFLDSNVLTYIAFFEGYLAEGPMELPGELSYWHREQGVEPDEALLEQVHALRTLYLIDDQARFDWLFSEISLHEIEAIRNVLKRQTHYSLLERLIEHRADVYDEEGSDAVAEPRDALFRRWQPALPKKMWNDGRLLAEASVVEADYFVTNDTISSHAPPASTRQPRQHGRVTSRSCSGS